MINEGGPGVPVSPYGHTLIDTIGATGYDVVQLIGHPTRARNIRHTAPGRGEGRGGERRGGEGRGGEGRSEEGRGGQRRGGERRSEEGRGKEGRGGEGKGEKGRGGEGMNTPIQL